MHFHTVVNSTDAVKWVTDIQFKHPANTRTIVADIRGHYEGIIEGPLRNYDSPMPRLEFRRGDAIAYDPTRPEPFTVIPWGVVAFLLHHHQRLYPLAPQPKPSLDPFFPRDLVNTGWRCQRTGAYCRITSVEVSDTIIDECRVYFAGEATGEAGGTCLFGEFVSLFQPDHNTKKYDSLIALVTSMRHSPHTLPKEDDRAPDPQPSAGTPTGQTQSHDAPPTVYPGAECIADILNPTPLPPPAP